MTSRIDSLLEGRVVVDILPTEDEKIVLAALRNLFPDCIVAKEHGTCVGRADLARFKELLEKEQIIGTIEGILDENVSDGESHIDINKMAALAGRVGVDEGSPIGKIRLYVPWKKA
jgi:predicted RNA binding protein with dsRBD fold (UPF0201 family)